MPQPDDQYRFRIRSFTVHALRWDGTNEAAIQQLAGGPDRFYAIDPEDRGDDPDATAAVREPDHGTWQLVYPGDWIVSRDDIERVFRLPDDKFRAAYEPASEDDATSVDHLIDAYALSIVCNSAESGVEDDIDEDSELPTEADWRTAVDRAMDIIRGMRDNPQLLLLLGEAGRLARQRDAEGSAR